MLALSLVLCASLVTESPAPLPRAEGYVGCWYAVGPTKDEYKYKYSGGLATYPQQQSPIAIYDEPSNRTYFVYGGADPARKSTLHMVSYYDHATGTVPRPAILLDKKTNDAHDNPCLAIDDAGHLWVFSNAHGTARPSFIHRSVEPRSIDAFEKVVETNFSYSHPLYVSGKGFLFLHTKYAGGRGLRFATSPDGREWSDPTPLAHIEMGDYQLGAARDGLVASVFDFHPRPVGLDDRTNLYYLQTVDMGASWTNVEGREVSLPLTEPRNPALVRDYQAEGKLVYIKDVNFDVQGNPVILYLTSKGHQPGPQNGPYEWHTARWDGGEWVVRAFTTSDHNYDHGPLYIEPDGAWRVIAPTEPGPQPFGTGGDLVMWTSADQGATWDRVKQLTADKARNHTYVKRPLNAHPDFYALWADGDAREKSESSLYFTDRLGTKVRRLPVTMTADAQVPETVE
ncbi:BNR-4 repeat-containing protein [Paludisphaera sp.]|uniref:BNR-4 repeat-containing protein n=1 Tax=Paludisphaera sp. TaxID=2017432 RepID=UPI00301CD946